MEQPLFAVRSEAIGPGNGSSAMPPNPPSALAPLARK